MIKSLFDGLMDYKPGTAELVALASNESALVPSDLTDFKYSSGAENPSACAREGLSGYST